MQDQKLRFLRLLINRYRPGSSKALLAAMPEKEAKKILEVTLSASDPLPALTDPFLTLTKVHYSWIIPKLEALPKNQAAFFLSFLPKEQAEKIQQTLSLPPNNLDCSYKLKRFLANKWFSSLGFDEALPVAYLPQSDMDSLFKLTKQELVDLIDYLSLYDLGQEVQNIVDKKTLDMINRCLSTKKQAYLKQCLRVKERLASAKLNLELWDGNCEKLTKILHHRGLVRLGYALSGQHSDFIWHITHTFDTGRGEKLKRFIQEKEIPGVTPTLKKQVQNCIQFLTKVSSS